MTQEVDVGVTGVTKEKIEELTEEAVNNPRVAMLIQQFTHDRREYLLAMNDAFGPSGGAIPDVDRVRDEYQPKLEQLYEAIQTTAVKVAREELGAIIGE